MSVAPHNQTQTTTRRAGRRTRSTGIPRLSNVDAPPGSPRPRGCSPLTTQHPQLTTTQEAMPPTNRFPLSMARASLRGIASCAEVAHESPNSRSSALRHNRLAAFARAAGTCGLGGPRTLLPTQLGRLARFPLLRARSSAGVMRPGTRRRVSCATASSSATTRIRPQPTVARAQQTPSRGVSPVCGQPGVRRAAETKSRGRAAV